MQAFQCFVHAGQKHSQCIKSKHGRHRDCHNQIKAYLGHPFDGKKQTQKNNTEESSVLVSHKLWHNEVSYQLQTSNIKNVTNKQWSGTGTSTTKILLSNPKWK